MILPYKIYKLFNIKFDNVNTRKQFFKGYKDTLDKNKNLSQNEINALNNFLNLYEKNKSDFNLYQWSYIFATVFHETNGTFLPVKEAYWLSENWRKNNLRYYPYYGRGFVQITWEENYRKFSKLLNTDFVKYPDKVMELNNSFFILTYGFKHGIFTGKKISDYITDIKKDYRGCRRCINGMDKADLIASYANIFEQILY